MFLLTRFSKSFLGVIIFLVIVTSLFVLHEPTRTYFDPITGKFFDNDGVERDFVRRPDGSDKFGIQGHVIMPKLGNETAKQALGRATWKLMHTMTLRYPEQPTQDERDALESYFHLQARLYPCGECAKEFQALLKKYPPQTASRRSAALWLCHVHNQVNLRLHKPEFDCAHLDSTYDCGCGDDPLEESTNGQPGDSARKDDLTGAGLIKGGK